MSISELFHIGMEYLKVGLIIGILFFLLFLAGYYVVYRKLCRGKKKMPFARLLWWGILIMYLVVVIGVTLLLRGGYYGNDIIRPLFYSYRDAWVHWSAASWRNIIFNFCMFIPLGFWLPTGLSFFRRFWRTYLAGFVFTLLIETVQLITRRGIFEWDDVFGNTVGAMIGYGLFMLGCFWWVAASKRKSGRKAESADDRTFSAWTVFTAQIPLVLTILGFAVIFGRYERQELGNNPNRYVEKVDKDLIALSGRSDFDAEETLLPVYQVQTLTVQEARAKGEQILGKLDTRIDESVTIVYDNTLVLYSDPSRYILWIAYKGGNYSLSDFKVIFPEDGETGTTVTGADERTIREALARKGITVPAGARFEELSSGSYRFGADMIEDGDALMNGVLTCRYYGDFGIGEVRDDMFSCVPYKEFSAISEQEAYDKIVNGEFLWVQGVSLDIQVKSCEIEYNIDSKGFYQPDYCFACMINGEEGEIMIPALKSD